MHIQKLRAAEGRPSFFTALGNGRGACPAHPHARRVTLVTGPSPQVCYCQITDALGSARGRYAMGRNVKARAMTRISGDGHEKVLVCRAQLCALTCRRRVRARPWRLSDDAALLGAL